MSDHPEKNKTSLAAAPYELLWRTKPSLAGALEA